MTRFVVDSGVVRHLASAGIEVSAEHELLAPPLLRSQTLSDMHEAVQRGEIPADVAREQLRVHLADADQAPRRRAAPACRIWKLADQLGWASTYNAGYVALTRLQADAFVTLDEELARSVEGIVATAPIDALREDAPAGRRKQRELGPGGDLFAVRVLSEDLRVYVVAQEEPFPDAMDVPRRPRRNVVRPSLRPRGLRGSSVFDAVMHAQRTQQLEHASGHHASLTEPSLDHRDDGLRLFSRQDDPRDAGGRREHVSKRLRRRLRVAGEMAASRRLKRSASRVASSRPIAHRSAPTSKRTDPTTRSYPGTAGDKRSTRAAIRETQRGRGVGFKASRPIFKPAPEADGDDHGPARSEVGEHTVLYKCANRTHGLGIGSST